MEIEIERMTETVICLIRFMFVFKFVSLFSAKARTVPVPFCLESFAVFPFDVENVEHFILGCWLFGTDRA